MFSSASFLYKSTPAALIVLSIMGVASKASPTHKPSSSQEATAARQHLDKMAALYEKMKSYSGTVQVSAEVTGQPAIPTVRATVSMQKPHLAAMRFSDGSDANFAVFDGTHLFATSSRHKNQYVKQTTARGLGIMRVLTRAGMTGPGLTLLFNQPNMLKSITSTSSLSLGKASSIAGIPVVTVISKTQQGQNRLSVTYHIGKNDHLLRRMTLVQTVNGRTLTMVELHTNIKINSRFPSSTFTFTPPSGAKPVKAFTWPR